MKAIERTFVRPVLSIGWQRRQMWRKRVRSFLPALLIYALAVWLLWQVLKAGGVL